MGHLRQIGLLAALILISSIPIGVTRVLPLVDYPNHLARMDIIAHIDADNALKEFYEVDWAVLPNLAMDIVVPPMMNHFSPYVAGKIFTMLIFLLLISGTCALHRAIHGSPSYWPLLSVLFLYNRHFLWGFLNFLFGIGVCLWGLALWIHWSHRSTVFRLAVFSMVSLAIFFCHLYALGVYGLCILGDTLYRHTQQKGEIVWKEWGISMAQFLLPAILFIGFSPTAGSGALQGVEFGDFGRKFGAIFQSINNYSHLFDGITFALLAGLFLIGYGAGSVRLNPRMHFPLLLLVLFFLLMPEKLLTAQGADTRIPTPVAFLLVAGSHPRGIGKKMTAAIVGLLACLFLLRLSVIGMYWDRAGRYYVHYMEAFRHMEEKSLLYTAIADPGPWQPFPVPVRHLPCLAIIERSAMVPTLFAYKTQQPVNFKPIYKKLAERTPGPAFGTGKAPDWDMVGQDYDYVLVVREHFFPYLPPARWETVYKGLDFRLLRTR